MGMGVQTPYPPPPLDPPKKCYFGMLLIVKSLHRIKSEIKKKNRLLQRDPKTRMIWQDLQLYVEQNLRKVVSCTENCNGNDVRYIPRSTCKYALQICTYMYLHRPKTRLQCTHTHIFAMWPYYFTSDYRLCCQEFQINVVQSSFFQELGVNYTVNLRNCK